MTTDEYAVETTALSKRFGSVDALRDLSFAVEQGEIFGFLGPNGAGKSTTLNIMLGFTQPTSGSVSVLGLDAQRHSKAIRQRIGVLPEGYHTYDRLTGYQHLEFAIQSKGADDDPDRLLDRVGLSAADADRPAGGYSKGMAQRLTLAMALVGEPELLILDEPSTGLDPIGAREMRTIAQEENDRGATVLFSSHILDQVEAVCDRVGIIYDGEMVAVDTVDGLRDSVTAVSTLDVKLAPSTVDVSDLVTSVAGVQSVTVEEQGDQEWLHVESVGAKLDILLALHNASVEILDFRTDDASLEDVFHAYTVDSATPDMEVTSA